MKRLLFAQNAVENTNTSTEITSPEQLVEIQTRAMVDTYHTTCFDVKQLQEVLGIGETNAYKLVRSGILPSRTIGRRKVVPVAAVAKFLVMDEKKP